MGTQRLISLVVALLLVVGSIVYFRNKADETNQLHVYTWSNYFPDNLVEEFTQKTGIKVQMTFFSSNEEMLAKLKAGATGFDVLQPSDYMVRQMRKLELLEPLDHVELPNISHLEDYYTKMPYDPGNRYSVPFNWGTTGIAINTAKVSVPKTGVSWKILANSPDPKHTALLDDMREVFGMFLLMRGLSPNSKDPVVLKQIQSEIIRSKNGVLLFTSEPKPLFLKEEITVAHMFSVDAVQVHAENPKIEYFIPVEGGTIWTDNLSIPKTSKHKKEAYTFINYFLNPDNALKIITQNHLATPNRDAKALLPKEVLGNPNLYPTPDVLSKLYFLDDLEETLPVMNQLWTELKS